LTSSALLASARRRGVAQHTLDRLRQLTLRRRLGQIAGGAQRQRLADDVLILLARHDSDGQARIGLAQAQEAGEAGRIRQREVEQREVDALPGRQDMQGIPDRHRFEDPRLRQGQPHRIAERLAKQRMIVDDQEAGHGAFPTLHRTRIDRSSGSGTSMR